jgi:hypothetical protein
MYLDKPIESMVPIMGILGFILQLFGGIDFKINKAKAYEPLNLLQHTNIMQEKHLFMVLLNSLKSPWGIIRA